MNRVFASNRYSLNSYDELIAVFPLQDLKMYNHDMTVTKIGKRAQIIATAKHDVTIGFNRRKVKVTEGQEFRCSGHWNEGQLVYCEISDFGPNQNFIGRDVVLDPKDFFIYVLVEFVGE